jgi:hypothetical protein
MEEDGGFRLSGWKRYGWKRYGGKRYGGRPDKYDNMAGEPKRTLDRIFTLHPTTST